MLKTYVMPLKKNTTPLPNKDKKNYNY